MSNIKWEAQNYCNMELLRVLCVHTKRGLGGWNLPGKFKLYINTVELLTMGLWPLPVEQKDRLSLASHPHYSTTWTSLCESH